MWSTIYGMYLPDSAFMDFTIVCHVDVLFGILNVCIALSTVGSPWGWQCCDKIIITFFIIIYMKKELKTKVINEKIDPPQRIHFMSYTCYTNQYDSTLSKDLDKIQEWKLTAIHGHWSQWLIRSSTSIKDDWWVPEWK